MRQSAQSSRRATWLVFTALTVLGMVAIALVPPDVSGKPGRDHDVASSRVSTHERVAVEDTRATSRRGDVGAQVVGGSTVPQGQYTFMTYIEIDAGGGFVQQCGGTLIDPLFVLTAAHCVEDEDGALFNANQYTLAIGQATLENIGPANKFGVAAVSQHPDWDPETLENDAAVLELDEAVPPGIAQPLPIVGSGDTQFDAPGRAAGIAGWGLLSGNARQSPITLRAASLSVVSDATCEGTFGNLDEAVVICAGKAKKSSCFGDSGGPLFATEPASARHGARGDHNKHQGVKSERKKHHHKRHHKKKHHKGDGGPIPTPSLQIGVVSFVAFNCPTGVPGGYTQLSAPVIHNFIDGVVGG